MDPIQGSGAGCGVRNLYGIRGINHILKHSIFVIACLVLLSILLILAVPKGFLSIYSVS